MDDLTPRIPQQRRVTTALPGPRSSELAERRNRVVSSAVSSSIPVYAADADGGILVDVDGNSLIDLGSGIAVTTVGASAPEVAEAAAEAAGHFTHTCFMVTPYESYVALSERLCELVPGTHAKKAALFNSGAEAIENAVKVARHATGRTAVVAFDHAYHGRTNLTMAMTGKVRPYKLGFGPFAGEVYRMPASYPFRDGQSGEEAARRVITQISQQIGADQVACVVYETIQGEGGFIVPAPGFLPTLVTWCRENGIVFVADEVQSGMCRTGAWFAVEHEAVVPDLVAIAKGVGGGLPISAVVGRAEMMDAVQAGGLGGTYGGNPVACAGALAAIEVMERDDLNARAREIEQIVREVLGPVAEQSEHVGELRGRGAMMALEFVVPGTRTPDAAAVKHIVAHCLEQGVIVLSCGTDGNNIRLLPPVVISEELLREGLGVLADAIATLG